MAKRNLDRDYVKKHGPCTVSELAIVGLGATANSLIEDEMIRDSFRHIAAGVGEHGTFLRSFAMAMVNADRENFTLLKPAAIQLLRKYRIKPQ